jgi:uncharacterized protein YcbX
MTQAASPVLSGIIHYPIKSCRGFEVSASRLERMGLEHDRRMMVVSPEGDFLTQREQPRLALVTPELEDGILRLCAPGFDSFQFPVRTSGTPFPVNIWKSKGIHSIDQGEEAADWFSAWLGRPVRLVHFADGYQRRVSADYAVNADDHTGFADGYPILLASEASLADLNSRMDAPLPMNRFRPNLVVDDCAPFAEDTWKRIRIGAVEIAVVKPCARCVVTTIDKETLERSKEPLKTLATFRKQPRGVMFAQNAIPLGEGLLETGMPVEVLQ